MHVRTVVRVRYLLPAREDFEPCWPVLRRAFGEVRPAATMMVCGLADERMRIEIDEIEVDARRGPVGPGSGLRIEAVEVGRGGDGDAMVEEWRYVHNEVVPPAATGPQEARERAARYRPANACLGDVLVGCSTARPPEGQERVATVIARVLPAFRGRGIGAALHEAGMARARALGARVVESVVLAANGDGLRFAEGRGSWSGTGTCWMGRATSGSD
ncbi:GNAT family N-acetyltransferase [Streptomyces mutabilis]|uniref:GNAT family N-acetyltransferase n=1 Tax=Streptomyces mutabilis TaxID=67332 RepID=UPI002E23F5D7|nr:GNAT family N-acetyltransferase [Streptomyces mutabilis]